MIPKILAFVGDGEGKTSAALGHAVRAAGHGEKVAVIQFLKGRNDTGDNISLSSINGIVLYLAGEATFLTKGADRTKHIEKARQGISKAKEVIAANAYFLIVLDEVLDAVAEGVMEEKDLLSMIDGVKQKGGPHIILTGRTLTSELSKRVDLLTRMQKIKHYYDSGEQGIKGLDW